MNETVIGTKPKDRHVAVNARASMLLNSESISYEIDESDLQDEKHNEQWI
jgi:hypothetical protein